MKYEYPAVISYDHQDRVYYVNFPDIINCFTDGLTLREALDNAEDVLNLMLSNAEAKHESLPAPSEINSICLNAGEIVSMIQADTDLYSKIAI
ncbi:MAG: type II toxin-antitoxin system HicB family antitoxin [Synergistaceae bacterium]|nr:type II toxin-antitoxin system HicB family antitoxin [Synergistaceae bacterium]